ncbi:MAG: hypothetical protein JXR49_00710 [Acidobacteria bacterium]|nr:hypothetical protein [Acidobacteriota bacterium]
MKINRLLIISITLSLIISSVALALQLQETAPFEKFSKPLKDSSITEAEFRTLKAEHIFLATCVSPQNGIYPSGAFTISDDQEHLTMIISVEPASLPRDFDARKKWLEHMGNMATGAAVEAFQFAGIERDNVYIVKFVDDNAVIKAINAKATGKKVPEDAGIVAQYTNGKLTMF